jgi:hypothetical protein
MDISGVNDTLLNCLQYHTNDVVNNVDDERNFLRIWRRRWRDVVDGENARLFRFLRSSSELNDREFLENIRLIPPNSDWFRRHINTSLDLSGVLTELESRIGVPYERMRLAQHTAHEKYVTTLERLFELETNLNEKLNTIKSLENYLQGLTIVDLSGSEAAELQTAIVNYIRGVYREHAIDDAYKEFLECYSEWYMLRGLVLGQHVARSDITSGPMCSICTTDKICCALIPCGHTFCNNCGQRQRSFCYVCRSQVRERIRIYFV